MNTPTNGSSPSPKPKRKRHKQKEGAGRKDMRQNKDIVDKIIAAVLGGNSYKNACALAGIGERTLYLWMGDDQNPAAYAVQFLQRIKEASAQAIHRNVMVIQNAAINNWQAAAWFLERRVPQDWGRVDRVETTGANGGPIAMEVNEPPRLTKVRILELLETMHKATKHAVVLEVPESTNGNGNGTNGET